MPQSRRSSHSKKKSCYLSSPSLKLSISPIDREKAISRTPRTSRYRRGRLSGTNTESTPGPQATNINPTPPSPDSHPPCQDLLAEAVEFVEDEQWQEDQERERQQNLANLIDERIREEFGEKPARQHPKLPLDITNSKYDHFVETGEVTGYTPKLYRRGKKRKRRIIQTYGELELTCRLPACGEEVTSTSRLNQVKADPIVATQFATALSTPHEKQFPVSEFRKRLQRPLKQILSPRKEDQNGAGLDWLDVDLLKSPCASYDLEGCPGKRLQLGPKLAPTLVASGLTLGKSLNGTVDDESPSESLTTSKSAETRASGMPYTQILRSNHTEGVAEQQKASKSQPIQSEYGSPHSGSPSSEHHAIPATNSTPRRTNEITPSETLDQQITKVSEPLAQSDRIQNTSRSVPLRDIITKRQSPAMRRKSAAGNGMPRTTVSIKPQKIRHIPPLLPVQPCKVPEHSGADQPLDVDMAYTSLQLESSSRLLSSYQQHKKPPRNIVPCTPRRPMSGLGDLIARTNSSGGSPTKPRRLGITTSHRRTSTFVPPLQPSSDPQQQVHQQILIPQSSSQTNSGETWRRGWGKSE
ncbi:hypothetical protein EX30DRAFT_395673 [Ascodesmis nigricans]|uniref:Uncharacterized protein n=1 Tax=Ascodesmis nigricans TaxID=341454 RepID=A0A4S2MX50_9PEZI|nr:hypothetical protein EX30DRAFT_395673 [Ascodesmis nigricans]